ncbi:NTP transferase domain-containing protein [Pseudobacteriovorax antillogorgiicola]|uniref:CTP:molybdopterin cytidylyltransferase MocA n=1 Tax=Pseudobacteriovorax antillogorgiicola TaxID=1513793 RepID=A0A1Y6C2N8_9BACT|nr:NTP transferase domain-containing protein [Pseudobacteriovorax antillogorgiicola]TCS49784.1 CTP:molybdopterin cytidylyltransferase MocA [Pseudobacteriovorax antillogorgiicola]SMF42852.1 CTP:molybdopterin cytidylyltransferase MocA [Pseudobacteriovorax antillogorgiicola]
MIEQQERLNFLETQRDMQDGIIVVSLFSTAGSTYQKAGARLLVALDGTTCGLISGGCLEPEIAKQGLNAWDLGQILEWEVDTTDDADQFFGYGLGCKGVLTMVFEPVRFKDQAHFDRILELLRPPSEERKIIHAFDRKEGMLFRATQREHLWDCEPGFPEHLIEGAGSERFLVLREEQDPVPTVSIFGAGTDAVPLARLSAQMGWTTKVYDRSSEKIARQKWPDRVETYALPTKEALARVSNGPHQFVVAMTHNFESDSAVLDAIAYKDQIPYLGLLGPAHRREALFKQTSASKSELMSKLAGRLFSPIGLKTGGRQPSEIALSIVSEIQAVHRRTGLAKKRRHQKVSVVVLAAGASRRLDGPRKQLVQFENQSLLKKAITQAHKVANAGVFVVLGAHTEVIAKETSPNETLVYNPRWETGISSSIKAGFNAAIPNPNNSPEHSVLFCLVDQPLIDEGHLTNIIRRAQENQDLVAASEYENTVGVPAIIAAELAGEIEDIKGDQGCKALIKSQSQVSLVPSAELAFDIDTPQDLEALARLEL